MLTRVARLEWVEWIINSELFAACRQKSFNKNPVMLLHGGILVFTIFRKIFI